MDNGKDDIDNIIDDMVVFSDNAPKENDEKQAIEDAFIKDTEPEAEDTASAEALTEDAAPYNREQADAADDEPVYEETRYVPRHEEEDYPDDEISYDFEHDEDDEEEEKLIVPMLRPLLLWLVPLLAVILVIVWGMTTTNSVVQNYRRNFTSNLNQIAENLGIDRKNDAEDSGENYAEGLIEYKESSQKNKNDDAGTQYRRDVESDTMLTFDGAANAQFVAYRNGVICATTNYICYINKNGVREWEKNIAITDPILRSEGDFFLVAQNGGTRFTLYKGDKVVFDTTAEGNIHTGNVSSSGDVVLVTDRTGYKGAVVVYNKHGDKAFSWSSGSAQVISADISPSSRRVAVALLNTDSASRSAVYMFNMKKTESYAKQEFGGSLIYKVDFKGNSLNVFADNMTAGMKVSGEIEYRIEYGDSEATRASLADNGDKLILFTGTNIPMLNIYNKYGKLKKTISSQKVPGFAYISDSDIVYNVDREIILGNINAEIPYKYTAIMDIKGIVPVDKRSFLVIYSNSISMIRMKGVLW